MAMKLRVFKRGANWTHFEHQGVAPHGTAIASYTYLCKHAAQPKSCQHNQNTQARERTSDGAAEVEAGDGSCASLGTKDPARRSGAGDDPRDARLLPLAAVAGRPARQCPNGVRWRTAATAGSDYQLLGATITCGWLQGGRGPIQPTRGELWDDEAVGGN